MRIGILYRNPDDEGKDYPLDFQGRVSAAHVIRMQNVLRSLGHEADLVNLNLDAFEYLRKIKFDLIFNLCDDGFRNDPLLEGHVPAMLDILQIPYTGSGVLALATCVNKGRTKEILAFHNISTPDFQVFNAKSTRLNAGLSFPLIVKPVHEDASIGLKRDSVVNNLQQLRQQISFVLDNYQQSALVEKFIAGREVYVGILGSGKSLIALPISEIIFDDTLKQTAKICSYEAKWVKESKEYKATPVRCPANLDPGLNQKLVDIAKKAYGLFKCSDYGRIDFRLDQNNIPYVLEVNPNPDISEDAGLARMAKTAGMNYDKLIEQIIYSALKRREPRKPVRVKKPGQRKTHAESCSYV